MPPSSKAQRRLMGACEHGANWASCPKGMTKAQMHDYATTSESDLPAHVRRRQRKGARKVVHHNG